MDTKELMKPRILTIAEDTSGNFKAGDILTEWVAPGFENSWVTNFHLNNRRHNIISNPLKYPHLFRKLEWYENRRVEDMPAYLKVNTQRTALFIGNIVSVAMWDNRTYGDLGIYCLLNEDKIKGATWSLYKYDPSHFLPATEQDYINQQKQSV